MCKLFNAGRVNHPSVYTRMSEYETDKLLPGSGFLLSLAREIDERTRKMQEKLKKIKETSRNRDSHFLLRILSLNFIVVAVRAPGVKGKLGKQAVKIQ